VSGTVVGLCLGAGSIALMMWYRDVNVDFARLPGVVRINRWRADERERLMSAGIRGLSPGGMVALSLVAGCVVFLTLLGISHSRTVSAAFAILAVLAPSTFVKSRVKKRGDFLSALWPDVVDNLSSAVRAGLSLPQALSQLGEKGPVELQPVFIKFGRDYEATGRFGDSLDRLKDDLSDPVADRIIEALRVARDVGGNDLGRLLRTLSAFLRDDARIRGELYARQSWTINGARLAVASPWLLLLFLAFRPQAVMPYDSPTGIFVLLVGAVICICAYQAMVRIGSLPRERRVLK